MISLKCTYQSLNCIFVFFYFGGYMQRSSTKRIHGVDQWVVFAKNADNHLQTIGQIIASGQEMKTRK